MALFFLWKFGLIPSPGDILIFLENLYGSYGLPGLFIASFLEGIVYFGLYFPGSFIVALAVVLSDGSFISLLSISFVVAFALTITSLINYVLGRKMIPHIIQVEKKFLSKGLFLSMLHPNALAFYFFHLGMKRHNFLKILVVPLVMIPYGLVLGYFFYALKEPFKAGIENPYVMMGFILIWIGFSFVIGRKNAMTNFTISIVNNASDIDFLRGKESFHYTFDEATMESLKKHFLMEESLYLLAKDGEKFAGFCSIDRDWWEDGFFFVREILVDVRFQRLGVGQELMKRCIEHARNHTARGVVTETAFDNVAMQALCAKFGFREWENPQWKEGITYKLLF